MPNPKRRYTTIIRQRARELRKPQTPAEQKLWRHLRQKQVGGYYFRRQHPIDRFIVDFYCAQVNLIIEVDGESHLDQVDYDTARTQWLEERNYHLIRFTNNDVFQKIDAILEKILIVCDQLNDIKT